jgi:hypothetical protein
VQKNKNKNHAAQARRSEAHYQMNQGLGKGENEAKSKSKHPNCAEYHHGTSPNDHRRQPNKARLICHTLGAAAPPVALFGPSFGQLLDTTLAMMDTLVFARFNEPRRWFRVGLAPSMRGGSIFQRAPSSPLIKGGSLPSHTTTHKRRKGKERARASPLHGLRP